MSKWLERIRKSHDMLACKHTQYIYYVTHGGKHYRGECGMTIGHVDGKGVDICVGDIITFSLDGLGRRALIVQGEKGNYYPWGHEERAEAIFVACRDIRVVQPYFEMQNGWLHGFPWIYISDTRHTSVLDEQVEKSGEPTHSEERQTFHLSRLVQLILANNDRFEPVEPRYELLVSLFGESQPYHPDRIDEAKFKERVKVWNPSKGFYIYTFKEHLADAPLAIVRIDEDMPHGPNSHIDRITLPKYFCQTLNGIFEGFIRDIYRIEKPNPFAQPINDACVELSIVTILEALE